MVMVCWGNLPGAKAEDLERLIYAKAPKGPQGMQIMSTTFDRRQVFNNELSGYDFFLPPEVFLFSISYKVQYLANNACLEINEIFTR